jgi:hypothetical protein
MKVRLVFVLLAVVLLCAMAGITTAWTEQIVTDEINYQGILTDATGHPLNGLHSFRFRLYHSPDPSVPDWEYTREDFQTLNCTNGLFSTALPFEWFHGQAMWIGIKVDGDDEMTPLQEVRPVPYALSLRSGADIEAFEDSSALYLWSVADGSRGIWIDNRGSNAYGMRVNTTNTASPGVYIDTWGASSQGFAANTYGQDSPGIDVKGWGTDSYGMRAGSISSYGIYAYTDRTDHKYSIFSNDILFSRGIHLETTTTGREGARITTTGTDSYGVNINTGGIDSPGVYAVTNGGNSQGFAANTHGANSPGVDVKAWGTDSYGIKAASVCSSAIYAATSDPGSYGLITPNKISVEGIVITGVADVAEYMPVSENVTPGTVMIIGNDGKLQECNEAYDTRVAGIVSTEPGVSLGTKDTGNQGEEQIAVAGRVPCKVDATKEPIHAGDLLTTSNRPGYAMKATDPKIGTVLGKAMGTLESGTGVIEVLVTLQ